VSQLVIVKTKEVASIPEMHRLALKKIFDKFHMTYAEEAMLEHSVAQWPKKEGLTKEERRQIKIILTALIADDNGGFNDMKVAMKQHGLDYRKVYDCGL